MQNVEGNLYKWTNYITGWKLRFFVLRASIMYYYISKGEKVKGRIHINVSEVIPLEHDPLKFQIDTGTSMIYLQAEDVANKKIWVDALLLAKKKEEILDLKLDKQLDVPQMTKQSYVENITDNRLLSKINTTKTFLENFTKNNEVLGDMIKKGEITQNSLGGVLNGYKVSLIN